MKKRANEGLTKLADAAFQRVAQKVIQRAEQSGTPVIVCVNDEVKAVDPRAVQDGRKRARQLRRSGQHGDKHKRAREAPN
jgi:hypothetical protein